MKHILTFLVIALSFYRYSFSQYNDAQLWENIYLEKDITQRLTVHVNEEGRITENMTRPSYIYTDWGITYKVNKHLHFTVAYVPILKKQINDFISFRHQLYCAFTLKKKIERFVFYDRQMFQIQYNDINRTPNWDIPTYYLRNKVTIKYITKRRHYVPYIAEEYYFHWNNSTRNGTQSDRMRFYVGSFYKKDRVNEFELYYLIEPHYHITPPFTNWIIGFGYARNIW
jgi:hypothetical protein